MLFCEICGRIFQKYIYRYTEYYLYTAIYLLQTSVNAMVRIICEVSCKMLQLSILVYVSETIASPCLLQWMLTRVERGRYKFLMEKKGKANFSFMFCHLHHFHFVIGLQTKSSAELYRFIKCYQCTQVHIYTVLLTSIDSRRNCDCRSFSC